MRWATSRCWSAAPSSNSSDPTGSDKRVPRLSARTPASAEVRHPAPYHRQPTAPPAAGPRSPKPCDRQQPPDALPQTTDSPRQPPGPKARRPVTGSTATRRPTTDNRQPPPAAGPQSPVTGRRHPPLVAKRPPLASFGGNPLQTTTIRALRSPLRHPRRTTPDNKKNGPDSHEESSNRFFRQGTTPIENEVQSEVFDPGTSTVPPVLAAVGPLQPADFLNQPKTTNLNEP